MDKLEKIAATLNLEKKILDAIPSDTENGVLISVFILLLSNIMVAAKHKGCDISEEIFSKLKDTYEYRLSHRKSSDEVFS